MIVLSTAADGYNDSNKRVLLWRENFTRAKYLTDSIRCG